MNLHDLLNDYRRDRGIRKCTADRMRRSIAVFTDFIGHTATTSDLIGKVVNDWLCALVERYSPKTCREFRGDLLAIWRYAADQDLVGYPARIRIVRLDRPVPTAWTPDQVRQLMRACLRERHGGYLCLLLSVAYQTGLRRGDLLRLTAEDVSSDNKVRLVQRKSGAGHVCELDHNTAQLLRERGDLKPPVGIRRLYRLIERARRRAGIPRGAMQQMRRTGATQVELQQPGSAQRYLGHATAGLAYKYYVDWSQINRPIRPPPLQ